MPATISMTAELLEQVCLDANARQAPDLGDPAYPLHQQLHKVIDHCRRDSISLSEHELFLQLVPDQMLSDMLNTLCYDDAGRLFRAEFGPVGTFDLNHASSEYAEYIQHIALCFKSIAVSKYLFLDYLPLYVFEDALYFLLDLWLDNEGTNCNYPDGSFNPHRSRFSPM